MLEAKELVKSYGRQIALANFSAEFEEKCINVIIGPSGCGKTTLFHCISGLEPLENGSVILDDKVLIDSSNRQRTSNEIGYVLQGFSLFGHLTVLENLTIAPRLVRREPGQKVRERALLLLDKMQLADKHNSYPNHLSGGEQQRVAIARAIMMNPEVLLLDEPTTALDPQLITIIEKTLKELITEGLTLIISTHQMGFAKRLADKSFFMYQGELLESSKGSELLTNPKHPVIRKFVIEEVTSELLLD